MKTGLILEGGGMRGFFTTGVLDFFLENNIEFDNIIGVSAGACHAVSYLSKQHGRSYRVSTDYLDDKHYCGLYSLITTGDLFGAEMLYEKIPNELNPIDSGTFNSNRIKMQAVISNSLTGKAEYPYINDVKEDVVYIRASSSLPLVSRPVFIDGVPYFDGGICDSIPLKQSEKQGYKKNVVVLTQPRNFRKEAAGMNGLFKLKLRKYPKLIEAMKNRHVMYNDTLDYIRKQEQNGVAFVIAPENPLPVKRIEKDKAKLREAYEMGYNTAKNNYDNLQSFIND